MKSFVAYPLDFEKMLFPEVSENTYSGKLIAHYELYKKISHLEGSVVKCGISAEEGLQRIALFHKIVASHASQKVIAFEKFNRSLYFESNDGKGTLNYKIARSEADVLQLEEKLQQKSLNERIAFVPGNLEDSIPDYLIENPEFKISFLNIDLDNYEETITTLEFFYPRLVHGGIVIFDNYYKKEEDYRAVCDYFAHAKVTINNFSVNKGPHYIVRK